MDMSSLTNIVNEIKKNASRVILIFAFNSVGKTRLSYEYKEATKKKGKVTGVYYNAYSEDLFHWNNEVNSKEKDEENLSDIQDEESLLEKKQIKLNVVRSDFDKYHSYLTESDLEEKLIKYKINYNFRFNIIKNSEQVIGSITFLDNDGNVIKISRGEEQIFRWCFFLSIFETIALSSTDEENKNKKQYFFIDDPVSNIDEYNIFILATEILELIKKYSKNTKFIITTHNISFYNMLGNNLPDKKNKENEYEFYHLKKNNEILELKKFNKEIFLYHLGLVSEIYSAKENERLKGFHFVLLRQLLENISSYLGKGNFSYALHFLGINNPNEVANEINKRSHKNIFQLEFNGLSQNEEDLLKDIVDKIQARFNFKIN